MFQFAVPWTGGCGVGEVAGEAGGLVDLDEQLREGYRGQTGGQFLTQLNY